MSDHATNGTSASGRTATDLLEIRGLAKHFGAVQALRGVDFHLAGGEIVGLVGHNGAGKSTLTNIVSGSIAPTGGRFAFDGREPAIWSPAIAKSSGIRCVYQELSLATNLSAAENIRLMHRSLCGIGWRARARALVVATLDAVFPGHDIDPDRRLADLSIGARQMVEIACAFSQTDSAVRCVILDEPTSALGHEATTQLLAYVRRAAASGLALILITHRLNEIIEVCHRAVVMVDGRVVAEPETAGLTRTALVELMGTIEVPRQAGDRSAAGRQDRIALAHSGRDARDLAIRVAAGEIIGFAGLDGHGQRERLRAMFAAAENTAANGAAFVAGDRGTEGVFALWSIADNLTLRSLPSLSRLGLISLGAARRLAETWSAKLNVKAPSVDTPILSLSGGNQQKVLFARALASDARLIFLDDPMRGVDVGTKQEVYRLLRSEAEAGRSFVWYTTEFEELRNCDRLYVFREGRAVKELAGASIDHASVLEASFGGGDV
ncbi:MAG: sugar ABC transporter ATP-binding protein [Ancalomicrobiaceae bacterium]|nr:sugar ABC transporter ATP-binding protein [Ancalomicrobiaceae bacterium]